MGIGLMSSFAVAGRDWVLGMCVTRGMCWGRVGVWKVMGLESDDGRRARGGGWSWEGS